MRCDYVLMQYYIRYLKEIRGLKDSSVEHYTQALNKISKLLKERLIIKDSIYELKDIDALQAVKEHLLSDPDFVALDTRGNRMYSAALNNYFRFATGEEMSGDIGVLESLDIEIPAGEKVIVSHEEWKRSSIIKLQSIEAAGYKCEINPEHKTFTSKSTGAPYMEAHHAIPMKYQDKFSKSLDVYANIICLCPICHRLLHYGIENEKKDILDKLYYDRSDRLVKSGIRISKSDFIHLIG